MLPARVTGGWRSSIDASAMSGSRRRPRRAAPDRRGTGPRADGGAAPSGRAPGRARRRCRGRCRTGASSTRSTRIAGPSTTTRRPRAVRRSTSVSRPSSTSTASVPVRSVKDPSGADRRSRPPSIATRWSHTRSISPSRCDATITAIPNSVPVRRISSSISSRPAGIESVRRLVEQEQARIVDERLGELDPLLHPGRVAADRAVALLVQPDMAEDLGRTLAGRGPRAGRRSGRDARRRRSRSCRAAGSRAPACSRRARGSRCPRVATSRSKIVAEPAVGSSSPSRILRSVLLPAPFEPTRPTIPGSIVTVSPSSAVIPPG